MKTTQNELSVFSIQTPLFTANLLYLIPNNKIIKIIIESPKKNKTINFSKKILTTNKNKISDVLINLFDSIYMYYEKGKLITVPWDMLELNSFTKLQRNALLAVSNIPIGKTKSYKDIAIAIDSPKASRFIGNTMANNIYPLIIPCHRVIKSDGSLGNFGGGVDLKKNLLEYEKTCLKNNKSYLG
ncbi:MAG: MGMT family protein [Desulfobacterales bacterium]|nr:MGMT family protein [Desulfobacterales bacterium]